MNVIISAILLGISLCADCFAVALCSSVTVTREEVRRKVWTIAAVFAVIQTGLFLVGWGLGMGATELISEHVAHFEKFAHALGFLLLLYVGGAMFLDGVRSKSEHLNLGGMDAAPWKEIWPILISIFVFTALSVLVGMLSGSFIGRKLGYSARIVGGLVLIGLGVNILL